MVLPEKNLSSPPPQKKRKALGLALSVKKNSGLARPKKKELAPFEIKNRGASPIRQGQARRRVARARRGETRVEKNISLADISCLAAGLGSVDPVHAVAGAVTVARVVVATPAVSAGPPAHRGRVGHLAADCRSLRGAATAPIWSSTALHCIDLLAGDPAGPSR